MITKEQAFSVLETYLREKKRDYAYMDSVDNIGFIENKKCLYGKYAHQRKDVYCGRKRRSTVFYIIPRMGRGNRRLDNDIQQNNITTPNETHRSTNQGDGY